MFCLCRCSSPSVTCHSNANCSLFINIKYKTVQSLVNSSAWNMLIIFILVLSGWTAYISGHENRASEIKNKWGVESLIRDL
ncbi:hypothetical protein NPIL_129151, partial [Nephila pilipes]